MTPGGEAGREDCRLEIGLVGKYGKKRRLESMSGLCFDGVAAISAVAVTLGFVRRFALGRFCGVSGLGKAVAEPPHSKSSRRSGDR